MNQAGFWTGLYGNRYTNRGRKPYQIVKVGGKMDQMVGNNTEKPKGVSPVNGQPLPRGKPFEKGDARAREAQKKGARTKVARRTLREELLELLKVEIQGKDGKKKSTQEMISSAIIKQAMMGSTKAYEVIRDTIGEKPVENVNIVAADYSALESAFDDLSGGDKG